MVTDGAFGDAENLGDLAVRLALVRQYSKCHEFLLLEFGSHRAFLRDRRSMSTTHRSPSGGSLSI
jgi:hypothetical protein